MHQRSRVVRAALSGAIGLLLIAGCLPAPNRVTAASLGREGVVKQTLPKGSPVLVTAGQAPSAPSSPLPPPTILSNNGANILRGAVRAPASIISHNGGNIVSNNGGSIVSNNGGSIISHNGGNVISNNGSNLQIAQVPLAYTTVRLKDAAGNPVKDDQGKELVTKTDAEGNYSFPVDVKGRNLVIEADVDGQSGKLKSLLPKDGLQAGAGLDVDLTSTLTLAYILDQYVKGDLATFERLPKDIEAKARTVTETAIVQKGIELPSSLEGGAIVAKVDEVRKADPDVNKVFEEIRRILVVAGITSEGDGRLALEVSPGVIGGLISDASGNLYIFSQSRHVLWKLLPSGILQTIVASGNWGYPETMPSSFVPGHNSGLAWDIDGGLVVADTYCNRIVKVSVDGTVKVIAGGDKEGFSGNGGPAQNASLNKPTGVVVDAQGRILFSDSGNNVIRAISTDEKISVFAGDGNPGATGDGGSAVQARLHQPEGLVLNSDSELYIADYGNGRIRKVSRIGKIESIDTGAANLNSPIAIALNERNELLFVNHYDDGVHFQSSGGWISLFGDRVHTDSSGDTQIVFPRCLMALGDDLYLTVQDGVLVRINNKGVATRLMGQWQGRDTSSQLIVASGIAVDENEDMYISDQYAKKIYKVDSTGHFSTVAGAGIEGFVADSGNAAGEPIGIPSSLQISSDGALVFASGGRFPVIQSVNSEGSLSTLVGTGKYNYTVAPIGPCRSVNLAAPDDIAYLPDGRLIFSESDFNRIMEVKPDGNVDVLLGNDQIKAPHFLTVGSDGCLYFVQRTGGQLSVLRKSGELEKWIDESEISRFFAVADIQGLARDASGNSYVASKTSVLRIKADHSVEILAGHGGRYLNGETRDEGLFEISDIALSPSGNLYILEFTQAKRLTKLQLEAF